jgi:hypothetical protein
MGRIRSNDRVSVVPDGLRLLSTSLLLLTLEKGSQSLL